MKLTKMVIALVPAMMSGPVLAQDAEAGAKVFAKCQTCHVIANEAGEVLAGKNAKAGPNLYGMPGRIAGTYPDFKYGESIVALGASGFTWNEADFVTYVADPGKFLKTKLDDKGAKSKMSFKVKNAETAADLYAFLAQFGAAPAADGTAAPAEGTTTTTTP